MAKSKRTISPPDPARAHISLKGLDREDFGRRLEERMRARGWRQTDLVRASGLTRNAISVYLRGASLPNSESLLALAKAFNVDPAEMLGSAGKSADRGTPEMELRVSPQNSKMAWLLLNRAMPTDLAIKIVGMINDNDAATTD